MSAQSSEHIAGTYLGFDYGSKRIGISVGESMIGEARPLGVAANRHGTPDWQAIDTLIEQWLPVGLVVGIPLQESGTSQPLTGQSRAFGRRLQARHGLPVHEVDERYSSMAAQEALAHQRASGRRRQRVTREAIDATAAAVILQRWFSLHR